MMIAAGRQVPDAWRPARRKRKGSGEELERVGVAGNDHPEVPAVEGGDTGRSEVLGEGDEGRVGATEAKVGIGLDELADPSPVPAAEVVDAERAVDDGGEQRGLGRRSELAIEQVARLGDDEGGRDERPGVGLEQLSTLSVVGVGTVGGGQQRAGVDDEHSVAPESLSEQLVSLCGAACRAGRADTGERQPPPPRSRRHAEVGVELRVDRLQRDLLGGNTPRGGGLDPAGQLLGQMHDQAHRLKCREGR
jgi:hypothetical protein